MRVPKRDQIGPKGGTTGNKEKLTANVGGKHRRRRKRGQIGKGNHNAGAIRLPQTYAGMAIRKEKCNAGAKNITEAGQLEKEKDIALRLLKPPRRLTIMAIGKGIREDGK